MDSIEIVRSKRRTVAVEITRDAHIVVRAPLRMSDKQVERFLREKERWIQSRLTRAKAQLAAAEPALTEEEIEALIRAAKPDLTSRVERYSKALGVTVERVSIRRQHTRWGSCSAKGNLSFNCLLMLCPESVRDYVAVHEVCHRLEMNHSARFWQLVEAVLPDYRDRQRWVKEHERALFARLER